MKLLGYLALDLDRTEQVTRKPTGVFKSWINKLTKGRLEKEEQQEVVPMAELLGAVHAALAEQRHDNLIRLIVGERTVYDDAEGKADDLAPALDAVEPDALAVADRLQIIVEEEDDDEVLYVVLNVLVYRRHMPGAFPVWIRATAIEKDLLRREDEKPKPYKKRVDDLLHDSDEVVRRCERDTGILTRLLEELRDQLSSRLGVEGSRLHVQVQLGESPDDYYLSLRPEYWDAAELVRSVAAKLELPEETLPPKPLREFVKEQKGMIAAMEKRLLPKGTTGGGGAATWTEFSKRRVVNPATGNICQIRSLPAHEQHRYRMIFNRGVPGDDRVDTAGVTRRFLGRIGRGVTTEVGEELDKLANVAPRTFSFIKNKAYRKRVFKHSGKMLGQEMIDLADTMAYTVVRELIETGKIPYGIYTGNKVMMKESDHKAVENMREQMLDIAELVVGTIVPVGGFAVGGPLGGAIGLAGIKLFQKALNWHSKRQGGREWTILPSAWHERSKTLDEKREPDRSKAREELDRSADRVVTQDREGDRELFIQIQKELAENFRDFGTRVRAGEVEVDDDLLDVSTLKETDIKTALAEEERTTTAAEGYGP